MSLIDEPKAWENKKSGQYLKSTSGALVIGVDYDTITATYPTGTTEVYTYTLSAATVQTITVTYTTSSKDDILSVVTS